MCPDRIHALGSFGPVAARNPRFGGKAAMTRDVDLGETRMAGEWQRGTYLPSRAAGTALCIGDEGGR